MTQQESDRIEQLLAGPCWVLDFLPVRVPADSPGQFFAVERYYRGASRMKDFRRRAADVLLKLNCYYALLAAPDGEEPGEFDPAELEEWLGSRYLNVLLGGALLTADPEDTYMTLYGADEDLLSLTRALAEAEGLFLWE